MASRDASHPFGVFPRGSTRRHRVRAFSPPIWQTATFGFDRPKTRGGGGRRPTVTPEAYYTRYGNPNFTEAESLRGRARRGGGRARHRIGNGERSAWSSSASSSPVTTSWPSGHAASGRSNCSITGFRVWGSECTHGEPVRSAERFGAAIRGNTRLLHARIAGQPDAHADEISPPSRRDRAREGCDDLRVDSTPATPYNQRPLELGVDAGRAPRDGKSRRPTATSRREQWRGGEKRSSSSWQALIVYGMRSPHPMESWLLTRGTADLAHRSGWSRHNANALAIARFARGPRFEIARSIAWAWRPTQQHDLAARQMHGFGGMKSFSRLSGGSTEGAPRAFTQRLWPRAPRREPLGGTKTLVAHARLRWFFRISRRRNGGRRAVLDRSDSVVSVRGLEDCRPISCGRTPEQALSGLGEPRREDGRVRRAATAPRAREKLARGSPVLLEAGRVVGYAASWIRVLLRSLPGEI